MHGNISLPADCTIDNAKLFDHSTNLASPTTSGGYKNIKLIMASGYLERFARQGRVYP